MATEPDTFLPYHEPDIVTILTQTSLLLILNVVNTIFDKLIFCGLLGQVFVGVAFGTPGGKWLDLDFEDVIVQLGYLGLILLVYEGGLDTNFRSLKENLALSSAVAITGISFPMALSFILQSLVKATPIQAFAAGAALCSTSLGTTFTILSTSGLSTTRLGTVLSSAAMMDDVIGLVMVQVISNLGESADSFNWVTVVRPLAVSAGLAIAVPLVCLFVARPITLSFNRMRASRPNGIAAKSIQTQYTPLAIHTAILLALVTGATYAGTSNLFAAYLAGASVSWWDSEVPHLNRPSVPLKTHSKDENSTLELRIANQVGLATDGILSNHSESQLDGVESEESHNECPTKGASVYHKYYAVSVQRVLKPFFFASIGFAIPITDMFKGEIVWKGLIYTIIMLFGKLVTGLWLVRLDIPWPRLKLADKSKKAKKSTATTGDTVDLQSLKKSQKTQVEPEPLRQALEAETANAAVHTPSTAANKPSSSQNKNPLSLYPAAMLGTAMTARGEIGFLIASLAETSGLFASSPEDTGSSSAIYLVVTWAIVLCTIIGPLSVGTLVKRVRRLQRERGSNSGAGDPLGIWGVS